MKISYFYGAYNEIFDPKALDFSPKPELDQGVRAVVSAGKLAACLSGCLQGVIFVALAAFMTLHSLPCRYLT